MAVHHCFSTPLPLTVGFGFAATDSPSTRTSCACSCRNKLFQVETECSPLWTWVCLLLFGTSARLCMHRHIPFCFEYYWCTHDLYDANWSFIVAAALHCRFIACVVWHCCSDRAEYRVRFHVSSNYCISSCLFGGCPNPNRMGRRSRKMV